MRAIHLANLDKTRPVLILTRERMRPYLTSVTVAPITSRIRGQATEVAVDTRNGLDQRSVVNCDNIITIETSHIGRQVGYLLAAQEEELTTAISAAFDLA